MERRFAYKYAVIEEDGMCIEIADTTNFILDPLHVPISDITLPYLLKYYHPIPQTVTSFSDFQGKWYTDSTFQTEVPELNP